MEIIIISLLIIAILLLLFMIFKSNNSKALNQALTTMENSNKDQINKQFNDFTDRFDFRIKDLFTRNAEFERALNQSFTQY